MNTLTHFNPSGMESIPADGKTSRDEATLVLPKGLPPLQLVLYEPEMKRADERMPEQNRPVEKLEEAFKKELLPLVDRMKTARGLEPLKSIDKIDLEKQGNEQDAEVRLVCSLLFQVGQYRFHRELNPKVALTSLENIVRIAEPFKIRFSELESARNAQYEWSDAKSAKRR